MARNCHPSTWLYPTPEGLYCAAGKFHVDPQRPVERAVITHGHADHARPSHAAVLATPDTLEIMRARYGDQAGGSLDALPYGETRHIDGVALRLVPAGHILGSAQVMLRRSRPPREFGGARRKTIAAKSPLGALRGWTFDATMSREVRDRCGRSTT